MPSESTESCLSAMEQTQEQIFTPLDSTQKQIRLLKTLPPATQGTHPRDPSCSLHIESLDSDLQFDAISYCWGHGKNCKEIYIDGKSFRVTEIVYEILGALRSANSTSGYFWIDSICINQRDNAEKSLQIPMMDQIYSRAGMVHVWLGPAIPDIERFLLAVEKIESEVGALEDIALDHAALEDGRTKEFEVAARDVPVLQKAQRVASMLSNSDGNIMQPLIALISSPWWSRLWVVQETLLARAVILCCGDDCISWKNVILICIYLKLDHYYHGPLDRAIARTTDESLRLINHVDLVFGRSLQSPAIIPNSMSHMDVYRLLANMNRQLVTDPRDRIYGMLALLPAELRILPDYTMDVDQVYSAFTLQFMRWSKSLNILRLAGRSPTWLQPTSTIRFRLWPKTYRILKLATRLWAWLCPSAHWQLSLPSWVPYFPDMLWPTTNIHFNATRGAKCFVEGRSNDELAVRGHIIGSVTSVGSRVPGRPDLVTIREILANWRRTCAPQYDLEQLQHGISALFWTELVRNIPSFSKRARADILTNVEPISEELEAWLIDDASAFGRLSASLRSFCLYLARQAMFRTNNDLIGVCLWNLQPDDLLVIVAGCGQPLILRPQPDTLTKYRLIGSCTCAAISHGEYIHDVAKLRVRREETNALPADVQSFLKLAVRLYFAHEDYLWAVNIDRLKSTLRRHFRSMFGGDFQARANGAMAEVWRLFDAFTDADTTQDVPALVINTIASTTADDARSLVKLVRYCFVMVMAVYEGLQAPSSESPTSKTQSDIEDIRNTALRFGLLILEVHVRAEQIRSKEELDSIDAVVLEMEEALLTDHDFAEQPQGRPVETIWCLGLRLTAKEFLEVQAHVDELFEEMILV